MQTMKKAEKSRAGLKNFLASAEKFVLPLNLINYKFSVLCRTLSHFKSDKQKASLGVNFTLAYKADRGACFIIVSR